MTCLLCRGNELEFLDEIRADDVADLYKESFGIEVGYLFPSEVLAVRRCSSCGLKFFDPPVVGDENFYSALQDFAWYYLEEKPEYHLVSSLIKESDHVLDIGSGKGAFARLIKSKHYTGLDSSKKARGQGLEIGTHVEHGTIQEHALLNKGKYDVVCGFQVLEHVADIHDFIGASIDCVHPGGLLIYSVPSDDSFLNRASNTTTNLPPHHVSRWSDKALLSIGRLFWMDLVELHHEALSEIHLRFYIQSIVADQLKRAFGVRYRIVDKSLMTRIANKLGWIAGSTGLPFPGAKHAIGHTATVVLRKRITSV